MRRADLLAILSLVVFVSGAGCESTEPVTETVFVTETYTLAPGQERYLCFAAEIDEDLAVDKYTFAGRPTVHHMLFSRVRGRATEVPGFSECDVLFRASWDPLFIAGAGASTLELPDGAAHTIARGTQLVVQLHLLNVQTEPVTDRVEITMRGSRHRHPEPVGAYVFGTTSIDLPPGEESTVEARCELKEDVRLFAAFPHMHRLGTSMTFAHGSSEDALAPVFTSDPYDFEDQSLQPLPLVLREGDHTKVTCNYRNTLDHRVTFGESTNTEMCFFVGFAVGNTAIGGCFPRGEVMEVPPDPAAGLCEDHLGNELGVGAPCTRRGNECIGRSSCTADLSTEVADGEGRCIIIGCNSHDECGGGYATCCTPSQIGGDIRICTAEACRRSDCIPHDG